MGGPLVVDVVSDIVCPWCFIGKRRLEGAAAILERAIQIHWHPFQLNPGMAAEGISRREYRTRKFGSWEYSQQLDARVAENGRAVGIEFRHDRMERTPNSFRGHVLLARSFQLGIETQNRVAERLFTGYFTNGEDVGSPDVLIAIARECGVDTVRTASDLEDEAISEYVRAEEATARARGIQGVPLISLASQIVSEGAAPEEVLADKLRELQRGVTGISK